MAASQSTWSHRRWLKCARRKVARGRCIGDRHFDGLLDERIITLTNQDGSGNFAELQRLMAAEPEFALKLERLMHDSALAARLAAEAAVRGCLALDA